MFRGKEQNQEKKLCIIDFNENGSCDWKLIGNCAGTEENCLLGISILGFTFTELFLGSFKREYVE